MLIYLFKETFNERSFRQHFIEAYFFLRCK